MPRLTGGMDGQSPAILGRNSAGLEGLSYLDFITAFSRCDLSTAGDVIALRRCLAEYQAHPSPSGVGSYEEEERRWWLGTAGAGWLRVPFCLYRTSRLWSCNRSWSPVVFPRTVVEDSIRLYPLAVAQQIWGELMVPVSLFFSPGPLEYFALFARTSGPVLLGLSRTVQGLFRKSASDVLPVGTMVTVFLHRMGLATGSFCPAGCRNTEDPLGGSVVPA